MARESALRLFSPLIREWFEERLGEPTEVQQKAWSLIREGKHLLATAPTGSGKTLAAFLWAIEQLLSGAWPPGAVRVLYVSPLRALGNDVRRNLLGPLAALRKRADEQGLSLPDIRVLTRSGDTSAADRRRMIRRPPEILITTPESLHILVSSISGRQMLAGVGTVILDEIHALASSKRGTLLMAGVERLVPLAGEFQRVALSATARPLDVLADFVGGSSLLDGGAHRRRRVACVSVERSRRIEMDVAFPHRLHAGLHGDQWWAELARTIEREIRSHRSTLVFTRGRRGAEKVTRFVNDVAKEQLAFAHHGSLSREIRLLVEERMKRGELPAIVATTSLELGIDIGSLERVIMVQTPFSVSSALQRVGRAGHHVGGISRGTIFPSHGRDLLDAAVLSRCVVEGKIEPQKPVRAPLDVLAQIIVAMVSLEPWSADRLFDFLRCIDSYSDLSREHFDAVLEMLRGYHAGRRLRDLTPRIRRDRPADSEEVLLEGRPGALRLVYMAGGTIPDRGYYALRVAGSDVRIGELDEEFVWERTLGESFTLGTQAWRIEKISHHEVEVVPTERAGSMLPFWRSEDFGRGAYLAERTGEFLEWAEAELGGEGFKKTLVEKHALHPEAADALGDYLESQRTATASALPHRRHIVIEECHDVLSTGDAMQVVLHTHWGCRVNRPFALCLEAAWRKRHGVCLQTTVDDECVLVLAPRHLDTQALIHEIAPEDIATLLRSRLASTGFFGARFRECAARALLLPRKGFNRRTPLWFNRRRAKRLFDSVASLDGFPVVFESWRTCLNDEFEMDVLHARLDEVQRGIVKTTRVQTKTPSPFARQVVTEWTNVAMYDDDRPNAAAGASLSDELLEQVLESASLRPKLSRTVIEDFERRAQRLLGDYAPKSEDDLYDWLVERFLIPEDEWRALGDAMVARSGQAAFEWIEQVGTRSTKTTLPGAKIACVVAQEKFENAEASFDLGIAVEEYLRFRGPVDLVRMHALFGAGVDSVLRAAVDESTLLIDRFSEHAAQTEVCDRRNLETLLRRARSARQPTLRPLPASKLPLFLAQHQGFFDRQDESGALSERLAQLAGFAARAEEWESEILPARMPEYRSAWLDRVLDEEGLIWIGCGEKRLTFCFDDEIALFACTSGMSEQTSRTLDTVFPGSGGRFTLSELAQRGGMDFGKLAREIWRAAWHCQVVGRGFALVRQAIRNRFGPPDVFVRPGRIPGRAGRMSPPMIGRRAAFSRWRGSHLLEGEWRRVEAGAPVDALEESERSRERARQLIDRYGVVFRALLQREAEPMHWGRVFRALRLMELSGEIVAGYFFEGIGGLQFASHDAVRALEADLPQDVVYWMSATDPASPCGMGLSGTDWDLPKRQGRVHLVFHDDEHVMTSKSSGRHLQFFVREDCEHLPRYLRFFRRRLERDFDAPSSIQVETIDGRPAHLSSFADALRAFGFERTPKGLELCR